MSFNIITFYKIFEDAISFMLRALYKKDKGKPIVITGAPRSGTTWFGEMVNSYRVRVYHEPFINHTLLWNWNLTKNSDLPANLNKFNETLKNIQSGKEWVTFTKFGSNSKSKFPIRFSLYSVFGIKRGRVIIKDPGLCYLMDAFNNLIDCEVVLIFRNPLSIVSSLKRLNWQPDQRIKLIFEHPYFKKFNIDKFQHLLKNFENYSLIEKLALQTALLHYFMLDFSKKSDKAIVVFYEDLAQDPQNSFKEVFKKLDLTFDKSNAKNHISLSTTSKENFEKHVHTVKRDSSVFKEIWNKRLTKDEIDKIMAIYNIFQLGIYK